MRRILPVAAAALALIAAAYLLVLRTERVAGEVDLPAATATIGEGEDAVAVGPRGQVMPWLPLNEEAQLPALPIAEVPERGFLRGPVREQAVVLGAAPATLRPYLAGSYTGETGVVVELDPGIELRFGDATRVDEKWEAAVAVLADPSITELDGVDLHVPGRAAVDGSGHELPPVP